MTLDELEQNLHNPIWRICNLYMVVDKEGKKIPFIPNKHQMKIIEDIYVHGKKRILILKARQIGFSTLIEIIMTDCCLFLEDWTGTIIADTSENAKKLMDNKVRYAYNNMYPEIRDSIQVIKDNESVFETSNGSSIYAGMRARGGTNQLIHISELGKISATDPQRAKEIKTGAFPSANNGIIIIESTFEGGKYGLFYELLDKAMQKKPEEMTELDFELRFFAWWEEDSYRLKANTKIITQKYIEYFESLAKKGIILDDEQKTWYVVMAEQLGEDMKREYPSTAQEAIEVTVKGAYFAKEMADCRVEKRITSLDYDKDLGCYSFWDIGLNDFTSIWVVQFLGNKLMWLDCYQNCDMPPSHYVEWFESKKYRITMHFLPWDAGRRYNTATRILTYQDMLDDLGVRNTDVIPKTQNKGVGINHLRMLLNRSYFDGVRCEEGINALENYRREFIQDKGVYKEQPVHDGCSHYADSARYVAEAINHGMVQGSLMGESRRMGKRRKSGKCLTKNK